MTHPIFRCCDQLVQRSNDLFVFHDGIAIAG
jgi:hypothetical protein